MARILEGIGRAIGKVGRTFRREGPRESDLTVQGQAERRSKARPYYMEKPRRAPKDFERILKYGFSDEDRAGAEKDYLKPLSYKRGGKVRRTGLARLHRGERVLTRKQARKYARRKRGRRK